MFTAYPSFNWRRAMHLTKPQQHGEDVWALQIALNFLLPSAKSQLDQDGGLGKATAEAIVAAQHVLGLVPDGVAGRLTQRGLALRIGNAAKQEHDLAKGLPGGQIEHESGWCLGAFSPPRIDGTYDAGIVQRNTAHTPSKEGFNPVASIYKLCQTVREAYDRYGDTKDPLRRWKLAAGSWNAPAYTNHLAGVEPDAVPSPQARATLEAYMDSVTAYVRL